MNLIKPMFDLMSNGSADFSSAEKAVSELKEMIAAIGSGKTLHISKSKILIGILISNFRSYPCFPNLCFIAF